MSCWSPPPFGPELATRWIDDGSADAMLARQRAEVAARQAIARSALGARAAASSPDGLHLWLRLPPGFRPSAFQAAAERAGVRVVASATFAVAGDGDPAIRLGLGNPATREELRRGVEAVARLLAEGPADEGVV